VVIANALQLEADRRRAVPIRFHFIARAKFEVAHLSVAALNMYHVLHYTVREFAQSLISVKLSVHEI